MNPNKDQIIQLEELRKRTTITIPQDGINIRNLWVSLIDNSTIICETCPTTIADYKRKLMLKFDQYLAGQKRIEEERQEIVRKKQAEFDELKNAKEQVKKYKNGK